MQLNSPYLEAVQAISGVTPGEKHKELNAVARKIAAETKAHGDVPPQIVVPDDVPQPLIPRMKAEIANLLKRYESVIEALKSDDVEIVDRALRFNWFFKDGNENIINVDYFETNLFPCVSLNTRLKLIKKLATSLRASGQSALAEKFYTRLSKKYERVQAEPFLVACSETFIWDTIIEHKIILSCRLVKNLFLRYPDLIIRYMKLSKEDNKVSTRNLHRVDINKYSDFLPRLIKNHLRSLIELIELHDNCLGIKLSNKATERFLKSNVDVVLNNPMLYVTMMPLKVIVAKITKAQFKTMFAKIYPPKVTDFRWGIIERYIEYYPEQERISLLLDTYTEVYGVNMLENPSAINEYILAMLPAKERVQQARIKLEREPDWRDNRRFTKRMWRCYLPLEESIPSIKTEISKCSSIDDRSILLQQLFYTCKINDDKDALLDVLRYFTTRHKNERPDVIFDVLLSFVQYFDLFTLGKDHWIIINGFMRFLHIKDELAPRTATSKTILAASIYFSITHDLPIDEFISMVIEINFRAWNPSWCMLQKYPQYDRLCLDTMISLVPNLYPDDDKIWKSNRLGVLKNIVESIYDFNNRNAKVNTIEKLSINNYPWLRDAVKALLDSSTKEKRWELDSIISCLKNHEPELYDKWIYNDPNVLADVKTNEALKILKGEPEKIRQRWEDYLKELKTCVTYKNEAQRFVKSCRWHQDIPIKFVSQCLKEVNEETDENSLVILGILMEGSCFARVIEPLVPKESTIDVVSNNAKLTYKVIYAIPRAINLTNPPIPLSLMLNFCAGEYLNLGLISLTNLCRRVSVEKIEKFTKELTDRRISVKKHGIRLFGLVASNDEFLTFLADLWKTEKHRSIRAVVFQKIYNIFVNDPSPETWNFFKDCMNELTVEDDDSLDQLVKLDLIPNRYIAEFIEKIFETLDKLLANGFKVSRISQYVGCILLSINSSISNLLPEEYSEHLLRKYFLNTSLQIDVSDAGMRYAIDGYLRGIEDRLETRLNVFGKLYVEILKKSWDVPDPKLSSYFPINHLTHTFVNDIVFHYHNDPMHVKIMETILQSFLTVLKPEYDWITYTLLSLGIALKNAKTQTEIAEKISEAIPRIAESSQSSSALVVEIASSARRWIEALVDYNARLSLTCDVLEALCRIGSLDTCLVAARLLFPTGNREFAERHQKVIEFLKKTGHPTVISLVYEHINACTSSSC